jgi:DNA-binding response OmpR family regulator
MMEDIQRVLVVDDDPVTLTLVRHILEQAYFDVFTAAFTAASGEDALNLIKLKRIPHLAIVDINMPPGMDGFTFCKEAHKRVPGLPVIMLTGVGDEAAIVKAFDEFQAEDYVVKPKDGPIRADELVSRIRRVLRNQPDYSYTIESVATIDERLKVDVGNRTVFIADEEIALTPTENKLLAILMRHPGRTLANDYLLRQIWPMEYANEERLHTHVYRLRKKIEQNPKEPHYIVSDWGRGYIFPAIANS